MLCSLREEKEGAKGHLSANLALLLCTTNLVMKQQWCPLFELKRAMELPSAGDGELETLVFMVSFARWLGVYLLHLHGSQGVGT